MIEFDDHSLMRVTPAAKSGGSTLAAGALAENEIVEARVLHPSPAGASRLLVKGRELQVSSRLPFKAGRILRLKVVRTAPHLVLHQLAAAPDKPAAAHPGTLLAAIRENLWQRVLDHSDKLGLRSGERSQLNALLKTLTSRLFANPAPDMLQTLFQRAGYSWEARLAALLAEKNISRAQLKEMAADDLKGLILRCIHENEKSAPELKRLLLAIKSVQLLNQPGMKQNGRLFFPLPIQFPDGFATVGELILEKDPQTSDRTSGGRKGRSVCRIVFQVELSILGPLRVELALHGKTVAGRFMTSDRRTRQLIRDGMPTFSGQLAAGGFQPGSLCCILVDPERLGTSLMDEIVSAGDGELCLVA